MLVRVAALTALACALTAALVAGVAGAAKKPRPLDPSLSAPQGLKAFLLRADEDTSHQFPRTPSFAWQPMRGVTGYEFELSASKRFAEANRIWTSDQLKSPAASVPAVLPWMTGEPYALYARVRAITRTGVSRWSSAFGFNMRWPDVPQQLPAAPGLVRWTPVEGATSYQVWMLTAGKIFTSVTNVADMRDLYSFHQTWGWQSATDLQWRVRAVREVDAPLANGLPAVKWGPWSPVYSADNPEFRRDDAFSLQSTISDIAAPTSAPDAHRLTPAFTWTGGRGTTEATGNELYRVYVFSDRDCVNTVFVGAVVGSPAYAPRASGPLNLPSSTIDMALARGSFVKDGSESRVFSADYATVKANEMKTAADAAGGATGSGTGGTTGSGGTGSGSGGTGSSGGGETVVGRLVNLWDSGWPSGRYYWTVVGIRIVPGSDPGSFDYRETELPQDACAAGRVATFGKVSQPVVTGAGAPFVSGLSTTGRLITAASAKPTVYGSPLVAWEPALGAHKYEVQWSKTLYPWKADDTTKLQTYATSAVLPLTPGTWYYRVRGLDFGLPGGAQQMTWSNPVALKVASPTFAVVTKTTKKK